MNTSRRKLLENILPSALVLAVTSGIAGTLAAQSPTPPRVPPPSSPRSDFPPFPQPPPSEPLKLDPRAVLKKNQEVLKRDVKRLAELARQLESEMEKTDAAEVLSLQVVRKAEEIEKLAKNIKNLARG